MHFTTSCSVMSALFSRWSIRDPFSASHRPHWLRDTNPRRCRFRHARTAITARRTESPSSAVQCHTHYPSPRYAGSRPYSWYLTRLTLTPPRISCSSSAPSACGADERLPSPRHWSTARRHCCCCQRLPSAMPPSKRRALGATAHKKRENDIFCAFSESEMWSQEKRRGQTTCTGPTGARSNGLHVSHCAHRVSLSSTQ